MNYSSNNACIFVFVSSKVLPFNSIMGDMHSWCVHFPRAMALSNNLRTGHGGIIRSLMIIISYCTSV